jgi:hypothetical protein
MNIEDAAHRLGHDHVGGVAALAPRMGMSAAVLNSKINPHTKTHHLSITEMVRMEQLTGRHDMLFAHAEALGFVAVPMPCVDDDDVDHAITNTCAEFGDYLRTVGDAMADKKITPNEAKKLEKELVEMMEAATHLQALLISKSKRRG